MALDSLDVSGGGTCVSLTPFHIGEAGPDGGQTNNNNNNLGISSGRKVNVLG